MRGLLAALLVFAAASARAGDAPADVSDRAVESRMRDVDGALKTRTDAIEKQFSEQQTFEARLKSDALSFEKAAAGDMRNFLKTIRNMPEQARRPALQQFENGQAAKRREFERQLAQRRAEFNRGQAPDTRPGAGP